MFSSCVGEKGSGCYKGNCVSACNFCTYMCSTAGRGCGGECSGGCSGTEEKGVDF